MHRQGAGTTIGLAVHQFSTASVSISAAQLKGLSTEDNEGRLCSSGGSGACERSSSRCPDRMLGALRSERIAAVQGNFRKAMILFSKQSLVGYGDVDLACLSLVSGCVDVLSFVELRDLFASAMTGNTALLALATSRGDWLAASRSLSALLAFGLGVALATVMNTPCHWSARDALGASWYSSSSSSFAALLCGARARIRSKVAPFMRSLCFSR